MGLQIVWKRISNMTILPSKAQIRPQMGPVELCGDVLQPNYAVCTISLNVQYHHRSGKYAGGLAAGKAHIWLCTYSRGFNLDYFVMRSLDDHGQP